MTAFPQPPPYPDPPPPYTRLSLAGRSHTLPSEAGSPTGSVHRALPVRDTVTISRSASSLTTSLDTGLACPVTPPRTYQWLDEVEKDRDDFLGTVEKELASLARSKHEAPATESSIAEVEYRHGALRHDICVARHQDLISPSAAMFRDVCSTDLLFLIDTTTSMQPYIDAAKAQIKDIIDNVNAAFLGQAEVSTAIVGYKDHSDYPNIESRDFTTSVEQVHSFLDGLKASGGSDVPEDVLGGLHKALNAKWSHQTRCIIHIADAPPHGTSLQNSPIDGDSCPPASSESYGLTHESLLSRMIRLNINYALLRINSSTDRMAYVFSEAYAAALGKCTLLSSNQYFSSSSKSITTDSRTLANSKRSAGGNGLLFEEFELGAAYSKLQHMVVKIVTASASQTAMRVSRKRGVRKANAAGFMAAIDEEEIAVDVPVQDDPPHWDEEGWFDETLEMEGFSPNMKLYSASTLNDMISCDDNIKMSLIQLTIRKRSRPFAQGATRTASYACTTASTNRFVAKAFKKGGKTFDHVVEDMRGQVLCKAFALEFNALTGSPNQIHFIVTISLKDQTKTEINSDDHCMSLEPYMQGEYIRYNDNRGWVNGDAKNQLNELAQAFSHFSFERSAGQFMITDLQGVGGFFTDPSIHTRDAKRFRLSDTNCGESGFMFFFQTHKCNAICQKLGLQSNGTMFKSKAWKYSTIWPEVDSIVCCSNRLCGKIVYKASAEKVDQFRENPWCSTCKWQLKSSRRLFHRKSKAQALFLKSQGQEMP